MRSIPRKGGAHLKITKISRFSIIGIAMKNILLLLFCVAFTFAQAPDWVKNQGKSSSSAQHDKN